MIKLHSLMNVQLLEASDKHYRVQTKLEKVTKEHATEVSYRFNGYFLFIILLQDRQNCREAKITCGYS